MICSLCECEHDKDDSTQAQINNRCVQFCPDCFKSLCSLTAHYLSPDELKPHPLFQALRGEREIVVCAQHGGFGLSYEAEIEYLNRAGINYKLHDRESRDDTQRFGCSIEVNGVHWSSRQIARDDPVLVQLVKEWGKRANSRHSDLAIVKIPGDIEWTVEEYDGYEWVAEKHRVWGS